MQIEKYCVISYQDYCKSWFSEILSDDDFVFIEEFLNKKKLCMRVYRFIARLEKYLNVLGIPGLLKESFENILLDRNFVSHGIKKNEKVLFLFFEWSLGSTSFFAIKKLRKKYPNSYFCFMFTNVDNKIEEIKENMNALRSAYNSIFTFDKNMANKYVINHIDLPYSKAEDMLSRTNENGFDIYFCGADKGRASTIINIHRYLSSQGIKCDFKVVGKKPLEYVEPKDNKVLFSETKFPYDEVLASIVNSKCILEIVDISNPLYRDSYTMRVQEAVTYKKKLLSNCLSIKNNPVYNEHQFSVFQRIEDIDVDFITRNQKEKYADQHFFSPRQFLNRIETACNIVEI